MMLHPIASDRRDTRDGRLALLIAVGVSRAMPGIWGPDAAHALFVGAGIRV